MKAFLDASLLIYLNTLVGPDREAIGQFYQRLLTEELYTNLLVIDETLHISHSRYAVPYNLTLNFCRNIILPYTEVIPVEKADLDLLATYLETYRLKPSDAIHLATMRKRGINNIVSEDEEFDQVRQVERIWLKRRKRAR